ncbi:MAG TPA: tetratricopeptide repeat protein [Verrucomicrobiae bacterium]|jgi:tetratricopeptide (TPR) repeat protein|nr:tetratricopeptide repeat protein [Verrucomicrobiae bacterium]
MRWITFLGLFLAFAGVVRADAPDDQYLDIYNEILQADSFRQDGQSRAAAQRYLDAQTALQHLRGDYPRWNPEVVTFRLQYLAGQLQALSKFLPTNAPAASVVPSAAVVVPPSDLEQQISALQQQVRDLTSANSDLENKLKEALSVQPAAVSPVELAKREDEIVALKKEKDLLTVALQQAKAAPASTSAPAVPDAKLTAALADAKRQAADAEQKLQEAQRQIDTLKAAPAPVTAPQPATSDLAQVTQERDKLKAELEARTKDLADAEAHSDEQVLAVQKQLNNVQAQRDELQKKLAAATAVPGTTSTPAPAAENAELEQLRARLAVLDAKAVPYTPEELAILNEAPSKPPAQLPAAPAEHPHVAHSIKDLPPGAGALMADGLRAAMERDFVQAESKFKEVLRQDENNVYVLAHLANAQFAEGHLDECEKTVDRALALDPDDPGSLYLLGVLRYRQDNLDAALDALSRSAQLNSTNAGTENYLGCVLAGKGQRSAAETALRKALEIDPDYGDAHYNLALVYATEKPPSPSLARWHYKRAKDLGHAKSPALEKLLDGEK